MASVTPPSSYVAPASGATPPPDGEAVEVQAQSLPPSLQTNARDVALRGVVAGQNPDGTTRINTPRGPVDVQLPQPLPARGTEVALEVPAGSPPRTVTVTLPAQAPTPPPAQTPLPQMPGAQLPPLPGQPAPAQQPQGQPVPGQVQTQNPGAPATHIPVPSDAPAPSPQQALPSGVVLLQQDGPDVSPQHLLDFLKTSLQTFLKTPALPTQTTGNTLGTGIPEPTLAGLAQRPLQIGQLVRLTPLQPGQMIAAQTQAGAAQLQTPVAALAQLQGLTPGATTNVVAPRGITLPTPQSLPGAPTQGQAPMQTLFRAGMTQQVSLSAPQTSAPTGVSPRVNMPVVAQGALPVASLLTAPATAAGLPQSVPTSPQQFIIAANAGDTPHIIASGPIDVRVSALLPVASPQILQNPGLANLVHGSPASTPVLFAQVAGQTAQGLPVVELPTFTLAADGTIKTATTQMVLQFPARGLSPATVLKFDILPGTQMSPALTGMTGTGMDKMGAGWTAIDDILHNAGTPQGAANPALAAIPKPGAAAFTAPVLMFVAAMRGGDISNWMGEKGLETVRGSRRGDAMARLASDFTSAMRSFREDDARPASEWKSLNLPLMYGGELSRVQLHYRSFEQELSGADSKEKKSGMRFIMDLSLNRMGPMQIDGFSQGRKMDVTLRSEQALSPAMREAMRARYFAAVSSIGFAGELNFSADTGHKGWIDMDDHRGAGKAAMA